MAQRIERADRFPDGARRAVTFSYVFAPRRAREYRRRQESAHDFAAGLRRRSSHAPCTMYDVRSPRPPSLTMYARSSSPKDSEVGRHERMARKDFGFHDIKDARQSTMPYDAPDRESTIDVRHKKE